MSRRAAREAALQILYKADIAGYLTNQDPVKNEGSRLHEDPLMNEGRDMGVEHELAYWMKELAAEKADERVAQKVAGKTAAGSGQGLGNPGKRSESWGRGALSKDNYEFSLELIRGVLAHCRNLDEKINAVAREWDLKRMDVVDRNVMRLALFEMLFCPNIPQRVSVNEAVELAKVFCEYDSAKFINGILDRFIAEGER